MSDACSVSEKKDNCNNLSSDHNETKLVQSQSLFNRFDTSELVCVRQAEKESVLLVFIISHLTEYKEAMTDSP